ncbi:hypothetical protein E2320_018565 [Naja naja]|nr:hypothetical protein E2320_018565 [Naja naja]
MLPLYQQEKSEQKLVHGMAPWLELDPAIIKTVDLPFLTLPTSRCYSQMNLIGINEFLKYFCCLCVIHTLRIPSWVDNVELQLISQYFSEFCQDLKHVRMKILGAVSDIYVEFPTQYCTAEDINMAAKSSICVALTEFKP